MRGAPDVVAATRAAVAAFAERHDLLPRGGSVVVAVSGGPDSVCLLDCLHALAGLWGLRLHVACLDHMLRADDSAAADAAYVRHLGRRYGLDVTCGQRDVRRLMRERRISVQAAARLARFAFLEEVADDVMARTGSGPVEIATGHTASDQAETVLLHLIRGSGLAGLAGLRPRRGRIIHPLLAIDRPVVEAYCRALDLQPRHDPSNDGRAYTRNRVRHDIVPALATLNPRITEALARTATTLALDLDYMDDAARHLLPGLLAGGADDRAPALEVAAAAWQATPAPLRPHVVRLLLARLYGTPEGFDHEHIVRVQALLDGMPAGRPAHAAARSYAQFPRRLWVTPRDGVTRLSVGPTPGRPALVPRALAVPGDLDMPHGRLTARLSRPPVRGHGEAGTRGDTALLDAGMTGARLIVRSRLPGDRLQPAGMGGHHKKVQDLLTDARVPRAERDAVPIVVQEGGRIVWVVGYAVGESFGVTEGTREVLTLRWEAAPERSDSSGGGGRLSHRGVADGVP